MDRAGTVITRCGEVTAVGSDGPSTLVSPIQRSKTWVADGGEAKRSTRDPAAWLPPPEPLLTVTSTAAPVPVTTTMARSVAVTKFWRFTAQVSSFVPDEPG